VLNNKRAKFIIAIAIMFFYECIGFVFKIDFLKIITIAPFRVSIVGVLLWLLTAYFIDLIIKHNNTTE
jgi:hypothetical protein